MSDDIEIYKMELREASSDRRSSERVDAESYGTDSSDEIVFTSYLQDRENLSQGEIKRTEKTSARHANTKQFEKRKYTGTADNASVGSADIEARRTKIAQAMREARRLESPEQTAARRAKANEFQRKRRNLYRAAMEKAKREAELSNGTKTVSASTPILKAALTPMTYQEKRRLENLKLREARKLETPAEGAVRRAKAAEIQRRRRERLRQARQTETPEETAARLAKEAERITPEQAAARRAKRRGYERKRRERKALKAGKQIESKKPDVATETPEQFAARRKRATELQRNSRAQLRAEIKLVTSELTDARFVKKRTETPEEAAARRAKRAAYERQRRQRKALTKTETPEQAAARRQKAVESKRMKRELLQQEMPERLAALRAKAAAHERERWKRKACREESLKAAEKTRIRRANETPEQTATRRARAAAAEKKRREELKAAGETPEQTAARHANDLYRQQRLTLMREARKGETPEEAAARRAKARECQRRRREQLRAMREAETPEQTTARIAKETELKKAETPQQAAVRRAKRSESDQAVAETSEEALTCRANAAARERKSRLENAFACANATERQRQKRKLLKETETPEQAAERRAKAAANQKKRRELIRVMEPCEWLHANVTAAERERRRREIRAATETPEQAADRRAKAAKREKQRRQRKAFAYLQDSALSAKRKIKRAKEMREARMKETPEQAAARRKIAALGQRRRREQMRAAREAYWSQFSDSDVSKGRPWTRFQKATAENTSSSQNYTDEDLHSSSTESAFERPEGSSFSFGDHKQSLVEPSIAITKYEEDPWLCFDNTELSIVSENIFNETKIFGSFADVSQDHGLKSSGSDDQLAIATNLTWFSKLLDANKGRDEHTVYCEYIAESFRKCNRSITEIEVAKDIIEGIMVNLSTGAYRSLSSAFPNDVEKKEEAPAIRQPIIEPVVQGIILKEEVQL